MTHETLVRNPFMLFTHPEVVLAAVEGSERLKQLNRHLCRPLDRVQAIPGDTSGVVLADDPDGVDAAEVDAG